MVSEVSDAVEKAQAGAVVITATKRLARILRAQYALHACAGGTGSWPAPRILPWEGWIQALWEDALYDGLSLPARLDEYQELLVWEQVIGASPIGQELLNLRGAARAARDCWALIQAWRLDPREIAAQGNEDTRAFLDWAGQFEHLCEAMAWLEPARQPDYLADKLGRSVLAGWFVLAGFDEFTPQQREFLAACEKAGARVEVVGAPEREPAELVRAAFPDGRRELEAAARWARELLERGQVRRVGVVILDLEARRAQIERIFARILEPGSILGIPNAGGRTFNIWAAPPLERQPLVRAALLVLELEAGPNPIQRVTSVLRSAFLAGAEKEASARALLARELYQRGWSEVPLERLRGLCWQGQCPQFARALDEWFRACADSPARQPPSAWSRQFDRLLRLMGWPGERPLSSDECQALIAWNALIERFARLDIVVQEMDRWQALSWLRRMATETLHQPEIGPAPVEVLGVLDACNLGFDALWVAGLDEESWPPSPRPAPFLPLRLQLQHNLPRCSAERELEFAQRAMRRLLASAPRVVLSWPERCEDRELAPSWLIRHVPVADMSRLASQPDVLTLMAQAGRVETVQDGQAPQIDHDEWSAGGTRIFEYQALCPFRACAALRLGAVEVRLPEPGLAPEDRGRAVHMALEYFWKEVRAHAHLVALSEAALQEVLDRAAAHALAQIEKQCGPLPARYAALERQRLAGLLGQWLEKEKQRQPFWVIACEQSRQIELAGLRLELKVDRVDCLEDGRQLILDYKTGDCSPSAWDGDRPSEPQLPLYAVTHEAELAGVAYGRLKAGEIGFVGYSNGPSAPPGLRQVQLAARIEQWRATLEQLGRQFREGYAVVDPKNREVCRYCRLWVLCRVHELRVTLAGEEQVEC